MGASGEKRAKKNSKNDLKNEIKQELKLELKNEIGAGLKRERELEVLNDHKPVPLNIAFEVMKAICKITIKKNKRKIIWNRIFYELFIFIKMSYNKLSCNKSKFRK